MKGSQFTAVLFDWDLTLARVLGDASEDERLAALFRSQGLKYTLADSFHEQILLFEVADVSLNLQLLPFFSSTFAFLLQL